MKKIILGISILGMSFGIQAQTNVAIGTGGTTTASDFHYDSATKQVGIGIVPYNYTSHKLTVHADSNANIMLQSSYGMGNILFSDDYYGSFANMIRSQSSTLSFGRGSDWTHHSGGAFTSRMAIDTNTGGVGIGTAPTNHSLTVYRDSGYTNIEVKSLFGTGNIFFSDQEFSYAKTIRSQGPYLSFGRASDPNSATGGTFSSHMAINTNTGNVGIGTATTGSHKLAVEGSIGAREVKVELGTWSDFVFEKTYKLPSLKEVEEHIKENGHLENIPSEAEVLKNGIYLGDMNAKLLQKIEELTLYLIEQNKKIERLEKKVYALKNK